MSGFLNPFFVAPGYHKSFAFLTKLLRQQEEEAAAAFAADALDDWTKNLVKNSGAKLKIISQKLVDVENLHRAEIRSHLRGGWRDVVVVVLVVVVVVVVVFFLFFLSIFFFFFFR